MKQAGKQSFLISCFYLTRVKKKASIHFKHNSERENEVIPQRVTDPEIALTCCEKPTHNATRNNI